MIRSIAIILCAFVVESLAGCGGYPVGSTMCLPPRTCKSNEICGVSEDDKATILRLHNELRNKVAGGEETLGKPGPQPSANDMVELQWDDELALFAQRWADQRIWAHDCNQCRAANGFSAVGQNMYLGGSSRPFSKINWSAAVNKWYSEVKDMNGTNIAGFNYKVVGHYTQVVWADTTHVGCGVYTPSETCSFVHETWAKFYCGIIVCNYGPAGNYENTAPYGNGPACSSKSSTYPNLCAAT